VNELPRAAVEKLLAGGSCSRPPGKSGWRLVSSENHLFIPPVHNFTIFTRANQKLPSKDGRAQE